MIEEATANARAAAQKFAQNSKAGVGAIRRATQGVLEIDDLDAASPERKLVRVVTTVEFFIKQRVEARFRHSAFFRAFPSPGVPAAGMIAENDFDERETRNCISRKAVVSSVPTRPDPTPCRRKLNTGMNSTCSRTSPCCGHGC
jgi:hypothetical protein